MIFNVGNVDFGLIKNNLTYIKENLSSLSFIDGHEVVRESIAFRIRKEVNESQNGVDILDGDPIQVDDFISKNGGKNIFSLSYVFVNIKTGKFYYSSTIKIFEEIMNKLFHIKRDNLNFNVNYDDMKKINTIRIVKSQHDDLLSNYETVINNEFKPELISMMSKSEVPKQEEYQLTYVGGVFHIDKLKKIVAKYENDSNIRLSIKGTDSKGNQIYINERVLKRIDVDTLKVFDEIYRKSLSEILREIEERA